MWNSVIFVLIIYVLSLEARPLRSEGYKRHLLANDEFDDVNKPSLRINRQVVQPIWLSGGGFPNLFAPTKVRVTDENRDETAALRDEIQTAVKNNDFFITSYLEKTSSTSNTTKPAVELKMKEKKIKNKKPKNHQSKEQGEQNFLKQVEIVFATFWKEMEKSFKGF